MNQQVLFCFFFEIKQRYGEVDRGVVESRIRTCEKCTGQLLRCCFAAVESLQTTDMPLLTRYVAGEHAEPTSSTFYLFLLYINLFPPDTVFFSFFSGGFVHLTALRHR